jgi:hypothetical protein
MKPIIWEPKKVKVEDLVENPDNPKIINERGKKRLQHSLSKFGLAGTLIVNKDLTLIDGHSRKLDLQAKGIKEVWVTVPDRQLTDKEYKELNAVYDLAKAGEVDTMTIEAMLEDEVLDEWDLEHDDSPKKIREENLSPFNKTHILLSFSPQLLIDLEPHLEAIRKIAGVEIEQASN